MRGSKLGLLAAIALVAGVAGCSLPEVLPLEGGTSSGPSPYGPWYEQHWATNAVLLAAADQPDEGDVDFTAEERAAIDAALAEDAAAQAAENAADAPVEAVAVPVAPSAGEAVDFDNSSPYQCPASAFAPPPPAAVTPEPPKVELTEPPLEAPRKTTTTPTPAPASNGPIRY